MVISHGLVGKSSILSAFVQFCDSCGFTGAFMCSPSFISTRYGLSWIFTPSVICTTRFLCFVVVVERTRFLIFSVKRKPSPFLQVLERGLVAMVVVCNANTRRTCRWGSWADESSGVTMDVNSVCIFFNGICKTDSMNEWVYGCQKHQNLQGIYECTKEKTTRVASDDLSKLLMNSARTSAKATESRSVDLWSGCQSFGVGDELDLIRDLGVDRCQSPIGIILYRLQIKVGQ